MTITINGHAVEPGCYCEGHRGQYGPDHVFDLAVGYGFPVKSVSDNMHLLRQVADRKDTRFWERWHDPKVAAKRHALHVLAASSPLYSVKTEGRDGDPEWDAFPTHGVWEARHWLLDDIEEWMNDHTTGGTWGWDDGEFFLEYADDPDATYLWVCTDCYFAHHYGDNVDLADDVGIDRPEPATVPLSELDSVHWHYADAVDLERRFGETGEEEFSTRSCEGCGTHLAGARHRLVMWPDERAQQEYLTTMAQAYETCALWSSTHTVLTCPECGEPAQSHPTGWYDHVGLQGTCILRLFDTPDEETVPMDDVDAELTLDAQFEMLGDCEDFMKSQWHLVCDLDPAQVGHDFWLTRNGHGTGFWDRGHPEWLGKALTKASKPYGTADLYVGDDGCIHHS